MLECFNAAPQVMRGSSLFWLQKSVARFQSLKESRYWAWRFWYGLPWNRNAYKLFFKIAEGLVVVARSTSKSWPCFYLLAALYSDNMLLAQCVLCLMRLALVANAYARLEVRNRLKAAVHRRTWTICDKMGKFIGRVHDTVKVFHWLVWWRIHQSSRVDDPSVHESNRNSLGKRRSRLWDIFHLICPSLICNMPSAFSTWSTGVLPSLPKTTTSDSEALASLRFFAGASRRWGFPSKRWTWTSSHCFAGQRTCTAANVQPPSFRASTGKMLSWEWEDVGSTIWKM